MPSAFQAFFLKITGEKLISSSANRTDCSRVLGQRDIRLGREDRFHDLGVARHLLFFAGREGLDQKAGQQAFDFTVRQPTVLDAGGRADAFDGGDVQQRRVPVRRQAAERAPFSTICAGARATQGRAWRNDPCGLCPVRRAASFSRCRCHQPSAPTSLARSPAT